jgi:hypothetical protein
MGKDYVVTDCIEHPEKNRCVGNPPLEPKAREVEFFPKEEVLHEKVKIHRQPDHGR